MQKKLYALVIAAALAIGAGFGAVASEAPKGQQVNAQSQVIPVVQVPGAEARSAVIAEAKARMTAPDATAAQRGAAFVDFVFALLFATGGGLLAMTTLAVNKPRDYEIGNDTELPCVATDIVYEGAAVGFDGTSIARPLVAGDRFVGFAKRKADNQTVAGAADAIKVLVQQRGEVRLPISSTVVGDVGKAVYASDDDTFTLTQSTNSYVGRIVRNVGTGTAIVAFDCMGGGQVVAELTDSSGGTADDTLVAISSTFVQAEIRNNFADLAAKVNSLLRAAKSGG